MDFHSVCLGPNTFSAEGSFRSIPGSFYQTMLYFSHIGASKTEKMQMLFKLHICNNFIIISDYFTYEAHYLIKIK